MAHRKAKDFDTLLRVRERVENLKAQALAGVRREIRNTALERDDLSEAQMRTLIEGLPAPRTPFDAAQVRPYYQYERHLSRLVVEKDAEILALRKTEDERRLELEEASKKKKIVERLKERIRREEESVMRRAEQRTVDEIASVRAAQSRLEKSEP